MEYSKPILPVCPRVGHRRPSAVSRERAGGAPTYACTETDVRAMRVDTLEGLEAAWNELAERASHTSVFQTFEWHRCWWSAFRGTHELLLILAYRHRQLVGIAPMMVVRDGIRFSAARRSACFIGSLNHASDYCDFVIDPEVPGVLTALLDAFIAAGGFDRVCLSHFPSHSPNRAGLLQYFARRRARVEVEFDADAPVRILGDAQADRDAANKSSLRRHFRFFEKSGDLRFRKCTSEAEIRGYLDAFFEQHKARRALAGSPSQFCDPAQQGFYRDLVGGLLRAGWLRFDVVLFNGAPLAFHFGFEHRGRFIWYKPAFDVRFASKSPGEVLLKFLLEDAMRSGLQEFDFTVGSESFKYRFSNLTRRNERILVFGSATDHLMHRAWRCVRPALARLARRLRNRRAGA